MSKLSNLRTVGVLVCALAAQVTAQIVGPSTTTPCYVLPNSGLPPGSVSTVSLLTTGDAIGGYRMIGTPDGLGSFAESGAMTVLMTHELGATAGIIRPHGSKGSIVSRWSIDPASRAVLSGRDFNTAPSDVYPYDRTGGTWTNGTFAWDRYCSADLAAVTAFSWNGLGTTERIFLSGEETRPPFATRHGAAWANIATGAAINQTWELPHLGQMAWENALACPFPQAKTIVMCMDDSDAQTNPMLTSDPSELYVYVGQKQASGNDIVKAGLVGGTLNGMRVFVGGSPVLAESNAFGFGIASYVGSATFDLVSLGDASTFNGVAQQAAAIANNVCRLQRVEDGAWDARPGHENDFYFVTTATTSTNSRLFHMHFNDLAQPELGGTISILLSGSEGHQMLDNMCADSHGRLFLQEDPGSATRLAKVWLYDLVNGRLTEVAAHSAAFFQSGAPNFLTTNEESSGVLPVFDILGDGWYLLDVQNHAASGDPELVEGGQLLAMYVDPTLGRGFEAWFASPTGPGSIALKHLFGTPNATAFTAVSLVAGAFPNGGFYGVDIAFIDLVNEYQFGAPFVATLDATGKSTSITYTGVQSGVTLYAVALDGIDSAQPAVSTPVAYTIP